MLDKTISVNSNGTERKRISGIACKIHEAHSNRNGQNYGVSFLSQLLSLNKKIRMLTFN